MRRTASTINKLLTNNMAAKQKPPASTVRLRPFNSCMLKAEK